MKKICFLIGNLNNFGGTERVTSIIANSLASLGYEVTIASIVGGEDPFFHLNKEVKHKTLSTPSNGLAIKIPSVIYNLRKLLKKESTDILIVADTIAVMFSIPALIGLDVKHLAWEHFNFKSNLGNKKRWFFRRIAARNCDVIVTLTERDRSFWLEGTKRSAQIITIPNPCPYPVQSNTYKLKEEGTGIVLAVGRLTYQKGYDMLLKAWIEVSQQRPGWKLKIVGDGEELHNLETFIEKNKLAESVEMVGKISNVEDYYNEADIFCLSSRFEGFPMVLLETLSFGLPVVSFDCDTGPEEIVGDTGSILVPKNDIALLTEGLISLMDNNNKRESIHSKSKDKVEQYHPLQIALQWEKLIESLD